MFLSAGYYTTSRFLARICIQAAHDAAATGPKAGPFMNFGGFFFFTHAVRCEERKKVKFHHNKSDSTTQVRGVAMFTRGTSLTRQSKSLAALGDCQSFMG